MITAGTALEQQSAQPSPPLEVHRFMITCRRQDVLLLERIMEVKEEGRMHIRSLAFDNHDGKHTALLVVQSSMGWGTLAAMLSRAKDEEGRLETVTILGA